MSQQLYRRCGCRDENGRQYGNHCPELKTDPKHGTWGYYLSHGSDPKTKKRRQYREAGFKTKGAAASAVAELKTRLDKGTYTEPSKKTLAEYAPEALQRRRITGSGLKATTAANYDRYVRQDIIPSRLGEMRLTDIRRSHVNTWVAALAATRGAVTVRRALATLQMILSTAVRERSSRPIQHGTLTSQWCRARTPPSSIGSRNTSQSSSTDVAAIGSARCSNSLPTPVYGEGRSLGSTGPILTWRGVRSSSGTTG